MSLPSRPELSESALDALIARERTRVVAPLTEWHTLAAALSAEGVIRPQAQPQYDAPSAHHTVNVPANLGVTPRRSPVMQWGRRLVASVFLVGTGVVIGRGITLGNDLIPLAKTVVAEATDSVPQIKSPAQAEKVLARSKKQALRAASQYQRAAGYLAAGDTTARIVGGPEVYQERLAALDEVLATTREKLQNAPGDPVLTQYYQSAFGAREATLQQLGKTLPANMQISHY